MKPTLPGPHPPTLTGRVAARAVWAWAAFVSNTTRWSIQDDTGTFSRELSVQSIYVVWHNRQLLAPALYRRFLENARRNRRLASIASASRDGAIAARVLELFGATAVRGSSSRRGARAMVELIELARQGFDLAVTPDGPRGPRYEVKPGVIALAQHTGLPLVPISGYSHPKKVMPSWDGFQFPLPFARCDIHVGQALNVPSDLDEPGRVDFALQLQERMRKITRD